MPGIVAIDYASAIISGGLAIATAFRARRSFNRWAFVVGMLLFAGEAVFMALSRSTSAAEEIAQWQVWRMVTIAMIPGAWLFFSSSYARHKKFPFPTRRGFALALAIILPAAATYALSQHLIISVQLTTWGTQFKVKLANGGTALFGILLLSSVGVVMNLERTFRASVGTMRWRIKFMLLGIGLLFVVRVYTSSQVLLFRGIDSSIDTLNAGALIVGTLLTLRSLVRAGHFDLEVYPSQSVLQNSVTVLLAGAYLLIVGVLAKLVTYIGGDAAFATKALLVLVALVVLALALQSDRARLEIRQFVSRHFRRSPYDYRGVWKTFTEGTASRVEQSELCRELLRLIAETFQALSVSIWLLDDKKEGLTPAVSTAPSGTLSTVPITDASTLATYFHDHPQPFDLEKRKDEWAAALKSSHPTEFVKGGNRVCVPIICRGEWSGVIVIGDRIGGVPFSVEDFDMLKCVADHAAASLLNVQLSKRLLQAKELEAFQAMAAFFVHDLKNAASTLNLMLQNLPVHYDDPEFREDALRGISKTVSHINRLIGRLGLLRHELKIKVAEADLNEVVQSALTGVEHTQRYVVTKDIQPLPKILLDSDQMQKVVTNLLLNAAEAVGSEGGEVRIATQQNNGWVVLTVADDGCGMSPEFLAHSLFRPFQTTKKNGLGIGMFQSKMIVEAHGGRIAVTSEPGKGTTFRIFLRATSAR